MATAAFKSTTKRTPLGDSSSSRSSSSHRRSRSLSRFSHGIPPESEESTAERRARFVNTTRGSGFPEIRLDDLACEFFGSDGLDGRGRASGREVENGDLKQQRRGRSVSRHGKGGSGNGSDNGVGGRVVSESKSRRRRSVSVARYQNNDYESDLDCTRNDKTCANLRSCGGGKHQTPLQNKSAIQNSRQGLRRSVSQKDLKIYDDHSSQSSVLTDEEGKDAHHAASERRQAIYAHKKAGRPSPSGDDGQLYEVMKKELRDAVEEIRADLKNPAKNKQNLLDQTMLEEERGRVLSDVEINSLPGVRKRSNDRSKTYKRLSEEAEKYIEDFISSVEDTDISSLDGDKSDASSTLGGLKKLEPFQSPTTPSPTLGGLMKLEAFSSPTTTSSLSKDIDGVNLPWLQWETSNDAMSYKRRPEFPVSPKTSITDAAREPNIQDISNCSSSSRESRCHAIVDVSLSSIAEEIVRKSTEVRSCDNQSTLRTSLNSQFDMEKYLKQQSNEDLLFERWRQQQRISSGSLLLCNHIPF